MTSLIHDPRYGDPVGLGSGLRTVVHALVVFDAWRRTSPLLVAAYTAPKPSNVMREIKLLDRRLPTSCHVWPPSAER